MNQTNHTEAHIIRTDEEFDSLREEWSELHSTAGGSVFQTYTWQRRWWEIYQNPRMELRIVTVRTGGRLSAILPLFLERLGLSALNMGRIGFIGTYEAYGEYSILADPLHAAESVRPAAAELLKCLDEPGADILSFFRFPPESEPMRLLHAELKALGLRGVFTPDEVPRVMMNLPATWDEYIASLSGNEREAIKRKGRALTKKGAEIEIVTEPDREAFLEYVTLHGEGWRHRGIEGYFASKKFINFLSTVTLDLMSKGHSRLYFLKKEGNRFSAVHAFFMNGQCCFYLSGLDRNHELVNVSPGKVLLARVIRDAIEEGYKIFDFQGGDEGYKIRLGGSISSFAKSVFWKGGPGSAKVFLFLAMLSFKKNVTVRFMEEGLPKIKALFIRRGRST